MPAQPLVSWESFGSSTAPIPSVLDAGDFVLTRSARSALALALRCEGLGAGDKVLIPNYYCPTMPAPDEQAGAAPVFYPIGADALPEEDPFAIYTA